MLELGPGPGAMTRVLRDRGHAVTVVENDPAALEALGNLGVQTVEADLDAALWRTALGGQQFDVVLACDVLEHLRAPELVLDQLLTVLRPMGQLVISLPNIAYAGVLASMRSGVFDYTDKGLLDRTHLRFFTRRSIEKMLLDGGWGIRQWEANRLPLERSEFSWHWDGLSEKLRQALLSGWSDYDVYQWMVVAVPLRDQRDWELADARSEAQQLRADLQALRLVHEPEHASLVEHQKAFSQAKETIAQFQQEIAQWQQGVEQYRKELAHMQKEIVRLEYERGVFEAAHKTKDQAYQELLQKTWRHRLRRVLGR